jgi:hypothetical protein
MCAYPALRSERDFRPGREEHGLMDCPLCSWALPPPHCHGALIFDGQTYRCDLRGRACHDIHPLALPFRHSQPLPPAPDRTPGAVPRERRGPRSPRRDP